VSSPDVGTVEGRTALLDDLDAATDRLLDAGRALDEHAVRGDSRLPGWTRAHVLAHVARNAEALTNLLRGARTGTPGVAYASQEARETAIEVGARQTVDALVADLESTAGLFRAEADRLAADDWSTPVRLLHGSEFPAGELIVRRMVEVEFHHVDLDVGYTWRDWPSPFAEYSLAEPMRSWKADRMSGADGS
jgi:maleylpyruvate isomerase